MEIADPLVEVEPTLWQRKKLRIIILLIIGVILVVGVVIVIILVSRESYDDPKKETPGDDSTEENEIEEEKEQEIEGNEKEESKEKEEYEKEESNEKEEEYEKEEEQKEEEKEKEKEKEEEKFEYGLNITELEYRTNSEHLGNFILLQKDSQEYTSLEDGDKKALKYLVKAALILEDIELRIDNIHNIPFRSFLESEIKKNKTEANLTKILFDSQKGISAIDRLSHMVYLAKNHTKPLGMGCFPEDLTIEKFHEILYKMVEEGKIEEVKNITNQRSIVEWDENKLYLKSTDYITFFQQEFSEMADLFLEAAKYSTDADFNEYLKLQAAALKTADPMLDAYADKKWAELQNTTIELTLTRESYNDGMTASIANNSTLRDYLNSKGIYPIGKDCLGLRVGLINKNGTEAILGIKQFLPQLAEFMPYYDEYKPHQLKAEVDANQTMVDADLIILAGDVGAYRGQITLAENLPNDDKLSLTIGGGRRNVYHRQIRAATAISEQQRMKLEDILDPEQVQYYTPEAHHWYTIGHENAHSLGPVVSDSKLGDYDSMIEENKADMASLSFVDYLTDLGFYSEEQAKQIKVTAIVGFFMKVKPDFTQAHRVRAIMQNYFLFKNQTYELINDKIKVNFDKVCDTAYEMLKKIVKIQLNNNVTEAEEFYKENFIWTNEMDIIAEKLKKYDQEIHFTVENELADYILNESP